MRRDRQVGVIDKQSGDAVRVAHRDQSVIHYQPERTVAEYIGCARIERGRYTGDVQVQSHTDRVLVALLDPEFDRRRIGHDADAVLQRIALIAKVRQLPRKEQ